MPCAVDSRNKGKGVRPDPALKHESSVNIRVFRFCLAGLVCAFILAAYSPYAWAKCDSPVALQILGSGGPFGVGRASSGYIVWIDGVSRIMVDAGGGTFAQFHKADAQVSDVRLFAVSHFHPDHSSEIPALLWPEASTAHMAGPSGNDGYPSLDEFLDGLFGAPDAVFRVLGQRLNLSTTTVNVSAGQSVEVFSDEQIRVRGIGVPHGDVPTVGYRVDVGDASVGFSSDQNGTNPAYTALVRGVDLLIVHFAASETPVGRTAALHARPSVWGQMASDVQAGGVVLSHLSESKPGHSRHGSHSGSDLDGSVAHFRSRYDGPLMIAEDLMCIAIE